MGDRRGASRGLRAYLPWLDLRAEGAPDLRADVLAALTVAVLTVPQALAYAVIAGVPPAMGLYAATVPTVVGSLFRSSRHVITGPSNALSLLTAAVIGELTVVEPATAAVALCLGVGLWQLIFGALRLGALVDYISRPVVQGYITGAAVLILATQLSLLTATDVPPGALPVRLAAWLSTLGQAHAPTVALSASTIVLVLALRRFAPRWPALLIALAAGLVASVALSLATRGVATIADAGAIPRALPPLSLPDASLALALWPGALACTVLSLVESTSVARDIASRTGQRLDSSTEFFGQGMANLAGAFFSAYPTSGSLGRSAVNERVGARSRLSGALSGVVMIGVLLLLAPLLDHVPLSVLAGMVVVVAFDLIDLPALGATLRAGRADAAALVVTVLGTWTLRLDLAIGLGVAISLMLFLHRARLLVVSELAVDRAGRLRELPPGATPERGTCEAVRVLHVEGTLFFGASGELRAAMEAALQEPELRVLLLRLKRTRGLDATTAAVLAETAERARAHGQTLLLAGLRPAALGVLQRTGASARVGEDNIFPTEPAWLLAVRRAMARASELAGEHACGDACPVRRFAAGLTDDDPD